MTIVRSNLILLLLVVVATSRAELPTELDAFLEVLFDKEECESFISDGEHISVATAKCDPFTCDFPHQVCTRPATKLKDPSANQCREIPVECLTAANGGKPVPRLSVPVTPPPTKRPAAQTKAPGGVNELVVTQKPKRPIGGFGTDGKNPNPGPQSLCEQGIPEGRFCGFLIKYAFNRETKDCEQFWFPGCRTPATNQNLFDSERQCLRATRECRGRHSLLSTFMPTPPPTVYTPPPTVYVPPPTEAPPPPPPPPPPPKPQPEVNPMGGIPFGNGFNQENIFGLIKTFTGMGGAGGPDSGPMGGGGGGGGGIGSFIGGAGGDGGAQAGRSGPKDWITNFNFQQIPDIIQSIG